MHVLNPCDVENLNKVGSTADAKRDAIGFKRGFP